MPIPLSSSELRLYVRSEASEKSGRSPCPRPADEDEIAILLKLKEEFTGLTATQISRFLAKKRSKPRKEIQKKVHRILEEKGFVRTRIIGNYRFAKITPEGLLFLAKSVGLT